VGKEFGGFFDLCGKVFFVAKCPGAVLLPAGRLSFYVAKWVLVVLGNIHSCSYSEVSHWTYYSFHNALRGYKFNHAFPLFESSLLTIIYRNGITLFFQFATGRNKKYELIFCDK
jgi:hypothetical protein